MTKNNDATVSGYRDVRDAVLLQIRSGAWKPGTLIPGEIELAQEYGVSRATVNRAMQELSAKGYVERRRKSGTRVRPHPLRAANLPIPLIRAEIEATGSKYGYRLVSQSTQTAPPFVCSHLGVKKVARLLHVMCLHSADGEAFQVEDRWINLGTLPDVAKADFNQAGPNEWLVQRVPYTDVDLEIGAEIPPAFAAKLLQQPKSQPSLLIQRTTWLDDKSVTFVKLYFRSGYRLKTDY